MLFAAREGLPAGLRRDAGGDGRAWSPPPDTGGSAAPPHRKAAKKYFFYLCNKTSCPRVNPMKDGEAMSNPLTKTPRVKGQTDGVLLEGLLDRIAQKDTRALAELYRSTSAAVYGFALSILKNDQDAQDVLHDCYMSVYTAAGAYRPMGKPLAWMLTITRNLCMQRLREHGRSADLQPEDWERILDQRSQVAPEDRQVLLQCMELLSHTERQIVTLHATAGFKHREIASLLELPLPTVLSKYARALKKLRNALMKGE